MRLLRLLKTRRMRPAEPGPVRAPGRPPGSGNWRDAEHFEAEVAAAVEALRDKGAYPSQARVAQILHCHPDTIGREARKHGLDWREMVSRRALSKGA